MPQDDDTYTPSDFVVPVVRLHEDGGCGPFLGTGVFVGEEAILVTCDHVLTGQEGDYGIVTVAEEQLIRANVIRREPNTDLALLAVPDYSPPHTVPMAEDEDMILNDIVICFEYGTTITAGTHINFSPANRLGNVTRFRDLLSLYGDAGDQMLELSFPALQGASGAPILGWRPPFKLWGIVKANVSNELLPAQVETVVDETGQLDEETRFYLPQALAIHVKHIRRVLSQVDAYLTS